MHTNSDIISLFAQLFTRILIELGLAAVKHLATTARSGRRRPGRRSMTPRRSRRTRRARSAPQPSPTAEPPTTEPHG